MNFKYNPVTSLLGLYEKVYYALTLFQELHVDGRP